MLCASFVFKTPESRNTCLLALQALVGRLRKRFKTHTKASPHVPFIVASVQALIFVTHKRVGATSGTAVPHSGQCFNFYSNGWEQVASDTLPPPSVCAHNIDWLLGAK